MPDPALLECFPSPVATPFLIEHVNEEFTSVCPKTGHPDFGRIILRYEPAGRCVELKSLKQYLWSFRDVGAFHEAVTNQILDDLVAAVAPKWMEIEGDFYVRGGIHTLVRVRHEAGAAAG